MSAQTHGPDSGERLPIVSFIVAAYNAEPFIVEAVRSLLEQTLRDIEVVVIDDGSTDATRLQLERLRGDPRLRVESQSNAGVARARNHGIELARGRYLAIMDADDVCWPERAATQVAALRSEPDLVVVGGCARLIRPAGKPLGIIRPPSEPDAIRERMRTRMGFVGASIMMPAELVRSLGGYDTSYPTAEDFEFLSRVVQQGRARNLSNIFLDVRMHTGSKSFYFLEQQQLRVLLVQEIVKRGGWAAVPEQWREAAKGKLTSVMLEAFGVSAEQIHDALASTYLERISLSIRLGEWQQASKLLESAAAVSQEDSRFAAQLKAFSALVAAVSGDVGPAVNEFSAGLSLSPRGVAGLVENELKKRVHEWKTRAQGVFSAEARRRKRLSS